MTICLGKIPFQTELGAMAYAADIIRRAHDAETGTEPDDDPNIEISVCEPCAGFHVTTTPAQP